MASQATAGGAGGGAGASSTKGSSNTSNGSSDTASFGEVDESMVLDPASGFYNRSACADGNAVCSYLAKRYKHSVDCFLTPSGMSAISCIAQSAFSKPKWRNAGLIIHSSELYCDSPKVFAFLEQSLGIQRIPFNTLEADKLEAALASKQYRTKRALLFVEACSNPEGFIMDWSLIPKLRKLVGFLTVVVDNTWLSSVLFNPFDHGADIVVTSLTKYVSGGGAIAGAVLGPHKHQVMKAAQNWRRLHGLHVSPAACRAVRSMLSSQDARVMAACKLAGEVAAFLASQPKSLVTSVRCVTLPSHPSHKQAATLLGAGVCPGVVTFRVPLPKAEAKTWLESIPDLPHRTSFGAPDSRTDPWPAKDGKDATWCRLACGYAKDEASTLVPRLGEALKMLEKLIA